MSEKKICYIVGAGDFSGLFYAHTRAITSWLQMEDTYTSKRGAGARRGAGRF